MSLRNLLYISIYDLSYMECPTHHQSCFFKLGEVGMYVTVIELNKIRFSWITLTLPLLSTVNRTQDPHRYPVAVTLNQ